MPKLNLIESHSNKTYRILSAGARADASLPVGQVDSGRGRLFARRISWWLRVAASLRAVSSS